MDGWMGLTGRLGFISCETSQVNSDFFLSYVSKLTCVPYLTFVMYGLSTIYVTANVYVHM